MLGSIRSLLVNGALVGVSILVATLVLDRAMGWMGYPDEKQEWVTHPPHFSKSVNNIEFSHTFETNSQGLRSPEIPLEKPAGEYRLLMVGDSFVEGVGVEQEQTLPSLLQSHAREAGAGALTVINGGLSGTGPARYGKVIFNVLPKYDADGVLITIYANDVHNTSTNADPEWVYPKTPAKHWGITKVAHYLWPHIYALIETLKENRKGTGSGESPKWKDVIEYLHQRALEQGIPTLRIKEWRMQVTDWKETLPGDLQKSIDKGAFSFNILSYSLFHPTYFSESIDIDTEQANKKWLAMAEILKEIVAGLRKREKNVAIVYIPSKYQYDPESHIPTEPRIMTGSVIRKSWLSGTQEIQRRLDALTGELEVPYLDMTESLRDAAARGLQLNWEYDEHFNAVGNDFSAELIHNWIKENNLFYNKKTTGESLP